MSTPKGSPGNQTARVTAAEPSNIEGMVRCHIAAFPGQFMPLMGSRWLAALYRYQLECEYGISLVATNANNRVLGFCVGGEGGIIDEFLRTAVRRYALLICWKCLVHGLVRKRVLAQLLRKLGLKRRSTSSPEPRLKAIRRIKNRATLLSIGVLPETQGTGVAGELLETFLQASIERGFAYLSLTVRSENKRAIAFYEKHGWTDLGKHGHSTRFGVALSQNQSPA